ncbi:MAG: AAA family ATPase [Steroidobacteraceae bacterium]
MSPAGEFREAMQAHGLRPPPHIEPGRLHRFASSERTGDLAGWCKLFDDRRGGVFGDWREGWQETWQARRDQPMSAAERERLARLVAEAKREREAEEHAKHQEAAEAAETIWQAVGPAPADHPYLVAKGIKAHGLRVHDGALAVPVRHGGALQSLQFISADGSKRFLPGGKVAGGYFSIGKPDGTLCIAEGFATAASIHEATGLAVAVAFNAGNLLPVARAMREKFLGLRLVLCADDDADTEGNPGLMKARAAAEAVGGWLAVPDFGVSRPAGATDFNDLARQAGAHAVRRCIEVAASVVSAQAGGSPRVDLIRGDSIQPEAIDWLWNGWLAAGKFHLIAGQPGTGKTTIALALAATVTLGGRWPDGSPATAGSVVMWSGEDDPADTLIPRLRASGADMSRVHFVGGMTGPEGRYPFDPARDMAALSDALAGIPDVRLLIVDPVVTAVAGDSHKNSETRRGLQPLVDLAHACRCALLGVTHLSKGTAGRDPVERVTGSLAFGALARLVMIATRQEAEGEREARRVLMRAKSNIGPDAGGFAYELQQDELAGFPGVFASSVLWTGSVEGTAREVLAVADAQDDDGGEQRDTADWLRETLAAGPVAVADLRSMAKDSGLAWRTVQRARSKVGALSIRAGFGKPASWGLSPFRATVAPFAPTFESGATGANGAVGAANEPDGVAL